MTLETGDLPRLGNQVDVQLVTVVLQQPLQVDNERLKRRL